MELKFTPLRIAVLVLLVAGFWFAGGFRLPEDLPVRLHRMWAMMILMFSLGAVMATVVDHWIGNLDRTNLRWFYIIIGSAAMFGAVMYLHILRERVKMEAARPRAAIPAALASTRLGSRLAPSWRLASATPSSDG